MNSAQRLIKWRPIKSTSKTPRPKISVWEYAINYLATFQLAYASRPPELRYKPIPRGVKPRKPVDMNDYEL